MLYSRTNLLLALAGTVAIAVPAYAGDVNNGATAAAPEPAAPALTAFTTRARLALSYSGINGFVRSKNVSSVTNPSTGVFCITPSVALDFSHIYPVVSIEWGQSLGNALLAFWRDTSIDDFDCGSGKLEVQTFDFNAGGAPVPSQEVAFDLLIE